MADLTSLDPADALMQFAAKQAPLYQATRVVTAEGQVVSKTAAEAARLAGNKTGDVALKQGQLDANVNTQAINVADYMDVAEIVKESHGKRREAQNIKDALLPQIQADAAVTPWDDPLKWIVTQFTAPKTLQAYALADQQDKDMTQRITAVQRDTQLQQAIDLAPTADLVQGIAQDKSIIARAKGVFDAAQVELDAKSKLVQQYALEIGGNQALFNNWGDFVRTTLSIQATDRQTAAMDRAERRENAADAKLAKQEAEDEEIRVGIEGKMLLMGQPGYSRAQFRQLSPQVRSTLMEFSRTPVIGDNLGQAVAVLGDMNAFSTFAAVAPAAVKFLSKTTQSAAWLTNKLKFDQDANFAKLPEEKKKVALFTATEKTWSAEDAKQPINSLRSEGNPTKLDFATVTQWTELEKNIFAKSVRDLQMKNPEKIWTEKDMLEMFQGQISQISPDAPQEIAKTAAAFSEFYKAGMQAQFKHQRLKLFGMEPVKTYGISTINSPVGYVDPQGINRAVNVFNPVEVEHYAMQYRAKAAKQATSKAKLTDNTWMRTGEGDLPELETIIHHSRQMDPRESRVVRNQPLNLPVTDVLNKLATTLQDKETYKSGPQYGNITTP